MMPISDVCELMAIFRQAIDRERWINWRMTIIPRLFWSPYLVEASGKLIYQEEINDQSNWMQIALTSQQHRSCISLSPNGTRLWKIKPLLESIVWDRVAELLLFDMLWGTLLRRYVFWIFEVIIWANRVRMWSRCKIGRSYWLIYCFPPTLRRLVQPAVISSSS